MIHVLNVSLQGSAGQGGCGAETEQHKILQLIYLETARECLNLVKSYIIYTSLHHYQSVKNTFFQLTMNYFTQGVLQNSSLRYNKDLGTIYLHPAAQLLHLLWLNVTRINLHLYYGYNIKSLCL